MRYTLELMDASCSHESVEVDSEWFTIGRDPNCDLQLDSPFVSRYHTLLRVEDDRLLATDLGSEHGTWVNEEYVTTECELHDGDVLRMAIWSCAIRIPHGFGRFLHFSRHRQSGSSVRQMAPHTSWQQAPRK